MNYKIYNENCLTQLDQMQENCIDSIVTDPPYELNFMGSGSTGKAVAYENKERNKDYKFIGIELNKEYCDIAKARIDYADRF